MKGVLGAIPFAGATAGEIFNMVIQPGVTQRQQQWMKDIADGLSKLENQVEGFNIEKLKNNDEFLSVLIEASQCAVRTHQEEKLYALRNIVENSIFTELEFDYQKLFLIYVNDFTVFHIQIMKRISDNAINHALSYEQLEKKIIQDILSEDEELFNVIREELEVGKGLIKAENGGYCLSELGQHFMKFITEKSSLDH